MERPRLRPLPAGLFPVFEEAPRAVHRDGYIELQRACYSVPPEYVGRQVWARWEARLLRVFNQRREVIAVHALAEPGKFVTDPAHLQSPYRRVIQHSLEHLLDRARLIGPHTGAWAEPTAAILDSQSVKSAGHGSAVGYDAGKRIKGRKRQLLVDTLGLVLWVVVTPADTTEREGAKAVLLRVRGSQAERQVGSIAGFRLFVSDNLFRGPEIVIKGAGAYTANVTETALGTIRSVEHTIQHLDETAANLAQNLADTRKRLADTKVQVEAPFEYAERLASLVRRQQEIEDELDLTKSHAPGGLDGKQNEASPENGAPGNPEPEVPDLG